MSWQYIPDVDAFTIYHQVRQEQPQASDDAAAFLPALGHALAGATGSAASNLLVYPLDLVVTRLQVQTKSADRREARYSSLRDALHKIYINEGGISAFYTGVSQDTAKSICDSFSFFLAYNLLWRWRRNSSRGSSSLLSRLIDEVGIGMVAGAFTKAMTSPLQQIITRKQTATVAFSEKPHDQFDSAMTTREIAKDIYRSKGLQGFWSGYSASIILTLNPSLTMAIDSFLRRILAREFSLGPAWTFLLAALSKVAASSTMYPISLAKARAQVRLAAKDSSKPGAGPIGVLMTLPWISRREGPGALYSGLSGEVLKGFLSHGLTMLVKQRIHYFVIQVYFALVSRLKARRQHALSKRPA